MADVESLRDRVLDLARDQSARRGARYSTNDLYERISHHHQGQPPVSRATFYAWFGHRYSPKQSILECIPAFAAVLDVHEYELWAAAGVLSAENVAALELGSVANDLRNAYRRMSKALSGNGLYTAAEALVVDRILHRKLDYRMSVWPVVRGRERGLHLYSWILLEPIPREESKRRPETSQLLTASVDEQRRVIRKEAITEGLWRSLGLKWRIRKSPDGTQLDDGTLCIEVPVVERGRAPHPEPSPGTTLDRLLVIGAPWSHAELMASLLADALRFGSWDLRYIGFPTDREVETKVQFCRQKLAERRSGYVWAIAQRFDVMRELREDVLAAAAGAPVVVVTYGNEVVKFAADVLQATRVADIDTALVLVKSLVGELRVFTDVVHVHIEAADVLRDEDGQENPEPVVRDLAVDLIRTLTVRVLDRLRWQGLGPHPDHWGSRFDDLRLAGEPSVPHGASTVTWLPRLARGAEKE